MIEAIFKYQFLQNAVFASVLASIVCGIVGVITVEKKLVMMSGGIAHTAYGGIGLGYLLGFEPILGAIGFSIAAALGIGYTRKKGGAKSDVIIALFWSFGMAMGIMLIGLMPGYPPDMNSYLFGDILSVTRANLYIMTALSLVVLLIVVVFFNYWKAFLFDSEFAKIRGFKTTALDYVLLILISLTVVILIRTVGIILIIALLTAPAATASLFSKSLRGRMIIATFTGIFFCFSGLVMSYYLNISSGAAIIVVSVFCYTVCFLIKKLAIKSKLSNNS